MTRRLPITRRRLWITVAAIAVVTLAQVVATVVSAAARSDRRSRDRSYAAASTQTLAAWVLPSGLTEVLGASCPAPYRCFRSSETEPSFLADLPATLAALGGPGARLSCAVQCGAESTDTLTTFLDVGRGRGYTVLVAPMTSTRPDTTRDVSGVRLDLLPFDRPPSYPWFDRL